MRNHFVHILFYLHLEVISRKLLQNRHKTPFPIKTAFLEFMRLSSNVVFYCGIYKDYAR